METIFALWIIKSGYCTNAAGACSSSCPRAYMQANARAPHRNIKQQPYRWLLHIACKKKVQNDGSSGINLTVTIELRQISCATAINRAPHDVDFSRQEARQAVVILSGR